MAGILPFADVDHPIWSPVANKIHAVIWDQVGLEVVQGFVQEWASNWGNEFNDAESVQQESLARVRQELHYPDDQTLPLIADNLPYDQKMQQAIDATLTWQPKLPALPLPPSPHSPRSLAEKWATLAALHDVYDLTGDTVLPWPLPEDDHDLAALTVWMHGKGGAYCLLMRKASELRDSDTEVIRRWLTDVSRDTPPKVTKPNDISQQLKHIEAAVATITNVGGTSKRAAPNQTPSAIDSEESSNAIEVPQGPSLRELFTDGLCDREKNKVAELIELEQRYWEQPDGKSNPLWQKRYQANRYQKQQAARGKPDLALIARRIFEAEKDRVQNLNVH